MGIQDHPKFDSSGNYHLHENHQMAFLHTDGFTERLLTVTVFITKTRDIEIYLHCFKKGNVLGDFKTEIKDFIIPPQITSFLEKISEAEQVDLQVQYNAGDPVWEDAEQQEYLFRHHEKTIVVDISGGPLLTEDHFKTGLGKEFFLLQKFMNEWIETLYDTYNRSVD